MCAEEEDGVKQAQWRTQRPIQSQARKLRMTTTTTTPTDDSDSGRCRDPSFMDPVMHRHPNQVLPLDHGQHMAQPPWLEAALLYIR